MSKEETLYLEIGRSIKGAEQSQMFGKPCFKINGKAFICFFENCMVFKLTGAGHKEALNLDGSELFDPSKKKRAMKEWVQVPLMIQSNGKNLRNKLTKTLMQITKPHATELSERFSVSLTHNLK